MKLAAKQRRLGQGAARMTDVPKVAPTLEAYGKLSKLLGFEIPYDSPLATNEKRAAVWRQRKFDQPERAADDLSLWLADEDNKKELIKKWRPRLAATRNKKQPAGSGLRTEHIKPFFDVLEWQFCVLFEAIERFAIPDDITRIAATVLATMLLKHGRRA
ncbi:hypothetical protein Ctob_016067 [Chrysochromulina tobinii]|uniref:Uncharacterized protein n=1 Tax=Chrysochromulina tobinii TaxID=1460289 RepID=A0A0M0JZJ5_9EUKA|nr:hypothetical protein Ctob_016067 [Chrysochromulina tobinii]|eukprot:KOO31974.1 hypothetical protein Ctob_016067 [Chrysochromulina sp. CCMP291]